MLLKDLIDDVPVGTIVYVIKHIVVQWESMRFDNTGIICGEYIVTERETQNLWSTNDNYLKAVNLPRGTKQYVTNLFSTNNEYNCFLTREEAEVWKVLELKQLEERVDAYIKTLKEKTEKKIKKIKIEANFEEYLEKYPEVFLKVI